MFRKKSIYTVVILIILLPLIHKPYRDSCYKLVADFFYPFLSAPVTIANTASTASLLSKSKQDLIAQVFKLSRKNVELEAKCDYLQGLKTENDKLKNLLTIKPLPKYSYLYAEVSYRDPAKWYEQFVINKGEDDGVKNGSIVLVQTKNAQDGKIAFAVAGRIGLVSKHTSVVYTLLSNECILSVRIPSNGSTGVLKGGERSSSDIWADITYLPKDMDYAPGALVTTSGLSTLAPRGLTIGTLDTPRNDDLIRKDLYKSARVELAADLNHIDFVLVLVE